MEPFLGQITLLPYYNDWAPAGWAKCEGQIMQIASNDALFSLLGTKFGGDGRTTFGLPDLRDAAPANTYYCIAVAGRYPSRN